MRHLPLTIALCLAGNASGADTRIDYVREGSEQPAHVLYVTADRVRMDMPGAGGRYAIFDAKAQTLTAVDPKGKTYTVVDQKTLDSVGAEISAARKQMQDQLAKLPPEQRAQIERMMGKPPQAEKTEKTAYTRTGRREKVAGHDCEVVTYAVAGERGELCVAAAGEIGLSAADEKTVEQCAAFMDRVNAQVLASAPGAQVSFAEIGGVPVRTKHADEPAQVAEKISHAALPASLFEVPPGFARTTLTAPGR